MTHLISARHTSRSRASIAITTPVSVPVMIDVRYFAVWKADSLPRVVRSLYGE